MAWLQSVVVGGLVPTPTNTQWEFLSREGGCTIYPGQKTKTEMSSLRTCKSDGRTKVIQPSLLSKENLMGCHFLIKNEKSKQKGRESRQRDLLLERGYLSKLCNIHHI